MAYTHYRVESPAGTTRRSGRASGALRVLYNGVSVETITSATTIDKSCSNKMMKSDIVFSDINWSEVSRVACGNKIMPNDLRIVTSITDGGTYQIITSSGVWVCPADVTSVNVFCVGGGGAGGFYSNKSRGSIEYSYAGGGGGGGYCSNTSVSVTPGASYAVTIGAGGSHSSSRSARGGSGGTTSFALNGTVLASASGGEAAKLTVTQSGGIYDYHQKDGGNGGAGGGGGGQTENDPESLPSRYAGGNGGSNGGNGSNAGQDVGLGGTGQGPSAVYSSVTGVYYSGGGGGGSTYTSSYSGSGGNYGGGSGGYLSSSASNGTANSGGGGGGGGYSAFGGDGGSGIMIISWT